MGPLEPRKSQIILETLHHDGGPAPARPIRRGVVCAVLRNPFAGRYEEENLVDFMEALRPLATQMAADLLAALGGDARLMETYGKGAIVGANGEVEHAAMWHAPGGAGLRAVLGGGEAPVPGVHKIGGLGSALDIPMGNIDAAYVRSHYDSFGIMVADAPRPDEILLALALGTGGRVQARLGGNNAADARLKTGRP